MTAQEILFNHLLKKEVMVVFDVDGVLAPYEFGDKKHCINDDEWDEMLEKGIDVYSNVQPVKVLQKFIKRKGAENVYVCSVSSLKEYDSKVAFCMKKYSILEDHIILVKHKSDKALFLDALSKKMNLSHDKIALIEDTVEILDQAAKSDYCTVHISSFFNLEAFFRERNIETKENKFKITKFERDLLIKLQNSGYNYIGKDHSGEFEPLRLVACDKKMPYHNLAELFTTYKMNSCHMEDEPFRSMFKFIWCGEQFEIQELLENCEVVEDVGQRRMRKSVSLSVISLL